MLLPIALSKAIKNALGAVCTLAAVAVELVLSSRMLSAHPIVSSTLVHAHTLVQRHDFHELILQLRVPTSLP
jgi:hypothetical protein